MPLNASFQIAQLSELLGTTPLRLNKLADVCRIRASVERGGAKGKRRAFSLQDICRLGLALWLWRAGLRGPAIRSALGRGAVRRLVSGLDTLRQIEEESRRHRFLIAVDFRGKEHGYRNVSLVRSAERVRVALREASAVVVPVGALLEPLAARLREFVSI